MAWVSSGSENRGPLNSALIGSPSASPIGNETIGKLSEFAS